MPKEPKPSQSEIKRRLAIELVEETEAGILRRLVQHASIHQKELFKLLGLGTPWGYVPMEILHFIVRRASESLRNGSEALQAKDLAPIPGFTGLTQATPVPPVDSPTKEEFLKEINAFRDSGEMEFAITYDVSTGTFTAPPPAENPEKVVNQYNALCAVLPMVATEAACSELELLLEVWEVDDPPEVQGPTQAEIRKRIEDLRADNDYPTQLAELLDKVKRLEGELANLRTLIDLPGGLREKAAFLDWVVEKGTDPNVQQKHFEHALYNILHRAQFMGDDYPDIMAAFRAALRVK